MASVTVVGIGADGWDALPLSSQRRVEAAEVVLGGERHLAMLPVVEAQHRASWPSPLIEQLPDFLQRYAGRPVVVLASGDPLVSGIGTTLIDLLGSDDIEIVPAVSSVALAHARMRWATESTDVITLVGRDPAALHRVLSPGRRLVVLSGGGETPARVAGLLIEAGYGASHLTVLADLGRSDEQRLVATALTWGETLAPALNVIAVECEPDGAQTHTWASTPGVPDEAYDHDGQLSKRDVRASALARLAPTPGELLWDVGAGAGSVAIEWMRTDPRCRAIAIEARGSRGARITANAAKLGVPNLQVLEGRAPEVLSGLPRPDAIFVGGGATAPGLLHECWSVLAPGGRLVVHGVTLETEGLLARWYGELGGDLTRIAIERADALGRFTGWSPARAVVQWAMTK